MCTEFNKSILGLLPSALAILPASGIDLALYETLKRHIEAYEGHTTNPIEKLIVGKAVYIWTHKEPGFNLPSFHRNSSIK